VFVHGLTGNRENTWTRNPGKKNACFWPQDLLPDVDSGVANARIATWGYDADVINKRPFRVVSSNTIEQHAANLCTDLANVRNGEKTKRPLIFVVHSLGGLVVKTALLHANECRRQSEAHISAIADSTTGLLFMGTPHRGSDQAHWGGILASVLGYVKQDNADLVKRLNKEEPRLALLQERFAKLVEIRKETNRPFCITCFYEELPVPVLGLVGKCGHDAPITS
jgi:pimeloyl-ACP methyl ester carboxylesterase